MVASDCYHVFDENHTIRFEMGPYDNDICHMAPHGCPPLLASSYSAYSEPIQN